MLIHTQDIFHKIAFDEMGAPCLIMDFALKVTIPALVKSLLEMQHDISTPANANQKNPVAPPTRLARPLHQIQVSLQKTDIRIELDEGETACLTMPFTVKLTLPGLLEFLLEMEGPAEIEPVATTHAISVMGRTSGVNGTVSDNQANQFVAPGPCTHIENVVPTIAADAPSEETPAE